MTALKAHSIKVNITYLFIVKKSRCSVAFWPLGGNVPFHKSSRSKVPQTSRVWNAVKWLWLLCAHNKVNKTDFYNTFDLYVFSQAQETNLSLSPPNFRPEQRSWPALLACDIVTGMLSEKILQPFPVKSLLGKSSWTASQDISVHL